jgi:crotonobetainyl-CoA:carnitine CoA-transferase CaiB-like acyl-CoA transferase
MISEPQAVADLLPLAGVRVVELGGGIAGAFCGKLLAGFGAEVVKVEPPAGDGLRRLGPFAHDRLDVEGSLPFLYLNTGKQSVTLDTASATGRQLLRRLAETADVVLQTIEPGQSSATYLDPAARPTGLVVTSIEEFGEGPYGDYLGGELIVLALGGLLNMVGEPDREPVRLGGYQAHCSGGLAAFTGTLAALYQRDVSGVGQQVEISVLETVAFVEWKSSIYYQANGKLRVRGGRDAQWQVIRCRDGYIAFVYQDGNWSGVKRLIGDARLDDDRFASRQGRVAHREELRQIFEAYTLSRDKLDIYHSAQAYGIPLGLVADVPDIVASPQYAERAYFDTIDHPSTGPVAYPGIPCTVDGRRPTSRGAPLLGEHNATVYGTVLGLTADEQAGLRERGIV